MNEIFFERENGILRAAIRKDHKLMECFVEGDTLEPVANTIYKGNVKNIVPAIKCAFIDVGWEKNCYMYLDNKFNNMNIKKGDEILVEVVKESKDDKGPKVTNAISIPGRYSVLMTLNNNIEFSQKIEDVELKDKLSKGIVKPQDIGVLIRTNAKFAEIQSINAEIEVLYKKYKDILKRYKYSKNMGIMYNGNGIIETLLRDIQWNGKYKIITNDKNDYNDISLYLKDMNDLDCEIIYYEEERSLFHFYGIEKEITSLRNKKVSLKCGGSITIDKTEAMYVIDVNSQKNIKSSSIEKTAFITNKEAAIEAARQITLRNLNGIILIDFIDMTNKENKNNILQELSNGFINDRNKTVIYPFTELNLVQIARRRKGKSMMDYITKNCDYCKGNGFYLDYEYIEKLIRNEIIKISEDRENKHISIQIGKVYENQIMSDVSKFIKSIKCNEKNVYATFVDGMDYFKVEPLIFANQILNLQGNKIYG